VPESAIETLDLATGVDQFLTTGEKRVTLVTEFEPDISPGRTRSKSITTRAAYMAITVVDLRGGNHHNSSKTTTCGHRPTRHQTSTLFPGITPRTPMYADEL
jgi:hypothetical protein